MNTIAIPGIQKAAPMKTADADRVGRDCENYVVERKFDGHRVILLRDASGVRIFAGSLKGQGREKTGLLPHVEAAAMDLPIGTILDGEACSRGRDSWNVVQSALGSGSHNRAAADQVRYVAFDVLAVNGHDTRQLPLSQRRELLEMIGDLVDAEDVAIAEQHPACDAAEVYASVIADAGEGVIIKDARAPYLSGKRPASWMKMKLVETIDVVVMGAAAGNGKYHGLIGALVFGAYDASGQLVELGQCSGMTDDERMHFTDLDEAGHLAGLVIEVAYNGKVGDGLRHPQYKRTRTDKPAADCRVAA